MFNIVWLGARRDQCFSWFWLKHWKFRQFRWHNIISDRLSVCFRSNKLTSDNQLNSFQTMFIICKNSNLSSELILFPINVIFSLWKYDSCSGWQFSTLRPEYIKQIICCFIVRRQCAHILRRIILEFNNNKYVLISNIYL